MTDSRLTALLARTYSRADLAYRIGVLKEFLEFAFYHAHSKAVDAGTLEAFEKEGHAVGDLTFLRSLPESFFEGLSRDSFYDELAKLSDASEHMPIFALTVPVMFDLEARAAIGGWVRTHLGEAVLLDISVDPHIGVGCQFVWHDRLHDLSFDANLSANKPAVDRYLGQALGAAASKDRS